MSKVKKIIQKSVESSLELIKPAAKIFSPSDLAKQVAPQRDYPKDAEDTAKKSNEDVVKHLYGVDQKEPENKEKSRLRQDSGEARQDYRKAIDIAESLPSHLRIPDLSDYHKRKKKGIYYEQIEEKEEREKQNAAQEHKPLIEPTTRIARGSLFGKIKRQESSPETKISRKTQ